MKIPHLIKLLWLVQIQLCLSVQYAVKLSHQSSIAQKLFRQWLIDLPRVPIVSKSLALKVATEAGFNTAETIHIGNHDGLFIFDDTKTDNSLDEQRFTNNDNLTMIEQLLTQSRHVEWFEKQIPRRRVKRETLLPATAFNDPLYADQWFLNSGVQDGGNVYDFGASDLWQRNYTGRGVQIALIDDGLEFSHPDIAPAYDAIGSYDFNSRSPLRPPKSILDNHGTRCAGQIVGRPNNSVCGVGLSYGATVAGIRLISEDPTDSAEGAALTYQYQRNHIYSSSWGPSDDGRSIDGPGRLGQLAFEEGVTNGRSGRGSIYVFASGNGGNQNDICTYDGYANSIYTISVGAVTQQGKWPYYGEQCAAMLISAYSGDGMINVPTVDLSALCQQPPCCTKDHFGTSAAAPFVSSLIAIMLQMRPELSWREVQHALINSTIKNDPTDQDWVQNGAGYLINHKYGFGTVQGGLLINSTLAQPRLPSQSLLSKSMVDALQGSITIAAGEIVKVDITVSQDDLTMDNSGYGNIQSIEHVQLFMDIEHPQRGQLSVELISPSQTSSILAMPRPNDDDTTGIRKWTFMTVRNWGESPHGKWTIIIKDHRQGQDGAIQAGKLIDYKLTVRGIACKSSEYKIIDADGRVECPWETIHRMQAQYNQRIFIAGIAIGTIVSIALVGALLYTFIIRRRYKRTNVPQKGRNPSLLLQLPSLKYQRIGNANSEFELTEIMSPADSVPLNRSSLPPKTPVVDISPTKQFPIIAAGRPRTPTMTRISSVKQLQVSTNLDPQSLQNSLISPAPFSLSQKSQSLPRLTISTASLNSSSSQSQQQSQSRVEDQQLSDVSSPKSPTSKQRLLNNKNNPYPLTPSSKRVRSNTLLSRLFGNVTTPPQPQSRPQDQ
ncbi:hypothetical protein MP228_000563 [Amoeboaphelidium protococcarum]|nr:hypothetical protein MP228_000563 [Amoeboaphelidium protococcarum]